MTYLLVYSPVGYSTRQCLAHTVRKFSRQPRVVPSMIVHLFNNTIAVVLARDELPAVATWMNANAAIAMATALVLVACGLALGAKGGA